MKKILLLIDGSNDSTKAVEKAIFIAEIFDYSITFYTVVSQNNDSSIAVIGPWENEYSTVLAEMMNLKFAEAKIMLDNMTGSLQCQNIEISKKIVSGSPYSKILEEARTGYDLIIMGYRSFNTLKRLCLSSFAKRFFENTPCSVLIVK